MLSVLAGSPGCAVFTPGFLGGGGLAEGVLEACPLVPSQRAFVSHAARGKKGVLVPCVLQVL